jgi:hypothetical protein
MQSAIVTIIITTTSLILISLPYSFSLLDQQKTAIFWAYKKRQAHIHIVKCNEIKIVGQKLLKVS